MSDPLIIPTGLLDTLRDGLREQIATATEHLTDAVEHAGGAEHPGGLKGPVGEASLQALRGWWQERLHV